MKLGIATYIQDTSGYGDVITQMIGRRVPIMVDDGLIFISTAVFYNTIGLSKKSSLKHYAFRKDDFKDIEVFE